MGDRSARSSRESLEWVSIELDERTELLDRTKWGREFNWKQLELIAQYTQPYRVRKDEAIVREGERAAYMCIILAGRVHVMKNKGSREPRKISQLGRGHAFGEMSLIDGEPRSATIVATTDVLLLMMRPEDFEGLIEKYPQIGVVLVLKLAKAVSQRLRMTSGALVEALDVSPPES